MRIGETAPVGKERYLEETVRTWLGLRSDSAVELRRLPVRLARRLLREEEYERAHRDQWGCWEFGFSESFREGTLLVPEVDLWVAAERRRLSDAGVPLAPLWPEGKRFAVCLTHDVDLVSAASTPAQVVRSMRFSHERPAAASLSAKALRLARPPVRLARAARGGISLSPDTGVALERSVAIEQEYGVAASYFFTVVPGRRASRYDCVYGLDDPCLFRGSRCRVADVLRQLAEDGFDVGLHGSYHSALEPGLLGEQRDALEQAVGFEVTTTRQHFLHWDVRTTPRLQSEAGLRADTTLGFNRGIGFRAGASLPFEHFDLVTGETLPLLQVPLIVQDGPLLGRFGLELDVAAAEELVRQVIDTVADGGGVATFLFHPNNLARDDFLAVFRTTIEYGSARAGWFASVKDIERWWRERAVGLTPG
jgi:peptidoglycan/xylan/chitin deacetylase (PgdA/CDA1 family)